MRSDAVSLDVPVKVHGSRVNDGAPGVTSKSEPFEEQTSSMIVFPQGGVLKMATPVTAGQMMVVTNLKSGHDSICRVVKVRAYGQGQSYVEVEFTHRQPGYWGVYFPSDGPEMANQVAPILATPPAQHSVETRVEKVSTPPKAPPAKPADRSGSVFAPIGSQEQVQPAASATSSRVKPSLIDEFAAKHVGLEVAVKGPTFDSVAPASASPAASISIGELQGDVESESAVSFAGAGVPGEVAEVPLTHDPQPSEHSASLGHLAGAAVFGGGHTGAREPFGSGLGSSTLGRASEASQSKGSHGTVVTIGAFALIAVAAGAAYYFHMPPFGPKSAAKPGATISVPSAVTAPSDLAQQPGSASPSPAAPANPVTTSAPVAGELPSRVSAAAAPARSSKSAPAAAPGSAAANASATENSSPKVPDMFGALNAHPTSRAYSADSGQAETAPTVDAPAADTSDTELSSITASSVLAPPSAEQEVPVRIRVGGEIKPPRLLSSVLPAYPPMARDAGVQGEVVIDTTIDKTGKVTAMKVVSGPVMLRQPALDALRQWKYEASKLDGEPVPVQMTVTIKFHRD
ncbi:MAG TPA: energy transducer TonB [Candidatus Acidoferrales bacterium]|nr:energy transducer TonB [Candidatus Acidoferrales bacterium]